MPFDNITSCPCLFICPRSNIGRSNGFLQAGGMDLALANDTFVKLMECILNHVQGTDTQFYHCFSRDTQ
jgi:hypothetical protein